MNRQPPPLRFIMLVLGGWIFMRTAAHAPGWWVGESVAAPAPVAAPERPLGPPAAMPPRPETILLAAGARQPVRSLEPQPLPRPRAAAVANRAETPGVPPPQPIAVTAPLALPPGFQPRSQPPSPPRLPSIQPTAPAQPGRWSGSAWLLVRRDGAASLAREGTLGGSQAGVRIGYRLNRDPARPLALTMRAYAPLGDRRAAEAALALDWRPVARLPLHLAAERRQRLGSRGRSAFALSAHGGLDALRLPAGFRLDAYGQAGLVGARSRDLFADGAARVTRPVGPLDVGAALSGGAQPGAARLDAGPAVSLRLPGARLRVTAEWRFRIAGDARPGSGPTLTLGSDF